MESSQQEDSKTSSGENDESENVEDDEGTGRSYECMFCKRGFNTAQALGGHMNIHRKDRAKIRQPTVPSVSSRAEEEYASTGFFPAISSYQPYYSAPPVAQRSHHMYLPGSTSSPRYPPAYQREEQTQKRQPLGMFDNDWRTSLSLQIGPSQNEDTEEEHARDDKEDELDLELRLGHDP